MKKIFLSSLAIAAVVVSAALTSCKDNDDNPVEWGNHVNESLVSAEQVATISKATIAAKMPIVAMFLKSDVKVVKVIYKTEYPKGTSLNVSGIETLHRRAVEQVKDGGQLTNNNEGNRFYNYRYRKSL